MSKPRASREVRDRKRPNRSDVAEGLEQKVREFAEQLGWLVKTVTARSEGWLDRKALSAQVTRIRDAASELMVELESTGSKSARGSKGSSRGPVDGPGKRHRPAPPATRGIKHSDERVAKVMLSRQMRRPRS